MLKSIRKLNLGYIFIMMGVVSIVSDFSLKDSSLIENTLLCFDEACMQVQAFSRIVIGLLFILVGGYSVLKK